MTTHPEGPDVVRLVQRLTTAASRYGDRAGAARGLHRSDLHALQAVVAQRTAGEPALTASQLAVVLGLTPSATTALIDRLERVGHVRREHDEADRRRVGIHMTESAGVEAREIFLPLAGAVRSVVERLAPDEMAVVATFLEAVAEAVEEQPIP